MTGSCLPPSGACCKFPDLLKQHLADGSVQEGSIVIACCFIRRQATAPCQLCQLHARLRCISLAMLPATCMQKEPQISAI